MLAQEFAWAIGLKPAPDKTPLEATVIICTALSLRNLGAKIRNELTFRAFKPGQSSARVRLPPNRQADLHISIVGEEEGTTLRYFEMNQQARAIGALLESLKVTGGRALPVYLPRLGSHLRRGTPKSNLIESDARQRG